MGLTENEIVSWPFGPADVQEPAYAATIAATIKNKKTIIIFDELTGDATLNLTLGGELEAGAELLLVVPASTNGFDLTLGSNIDAPVIVGVAGKTNSQKFEFDGTKFRPTGTYVQND